MADILTCFKHDQVKNLLVLLRRNFFPSIKLYFLSGFSLKILIIEYNNYKITSYNRCMKELEIEF